MKLTPWYKIESLTPREDLRLGTPVDNSEFAVNLDQVRNQTAPIDYQNPEKFFERTFLTKYLLELSSQVVRRLAGITQGTNAIFNLSTQFGGGKTHSLTLLYHLAKQGDKANKYVGVHKILERAEITSIPTAAVAVFVGNEFDSIHGRGGDDGTPFRQTPWGEIAFQLGGESAYEIIKQHDQEFIVPGGDVIRKFLPKDKPSLILIDEVINYVSRSRKQGYNHLLYNFLQSLSETVRSLDNVVLVISTPASELEYTPEDAEDEQRFQKMLNRVGKSIMLSAESETVEIIKRRLFEWDSQAVAQNGTIMLNTEAVKTCKAYAQWMLANRQQLPSWFPVDNAEELFIATYPFHPIAISVFERKWQSLPRFQRTRGILKLLALWVSKAYQEGYQGSSKEPLISLGTAPLDDPSFRVACFDQLGTENLEAAIITDISGRKDSHALRLDNDAIPEIKKAKLHRKVATTIFFESNGGQTNHNATLPEIRLAIGEPELEIANIETVLEGLRTNSYYLAVNQTSYRFNTYPNLNKILADRKASIQDERISKRVLEEIQSCFRSELGVHIVHFPEHSSNIPNQPVITLAVLNPEYSSQDDRTFKLMETLIKESGTQARTYKSAVIFSYVDTEQKLRDNARRLLAWSDIENEETLLDEEQTKQLKTSLIKAESDLRETVWLSYKNLCYLGKDNKITRVDLGLITSSQADSMIKLIINRLRQDGEIEESINPNFLLRNWSPAFPEWSTKAIRDAFFASPQFPRLLSAEGIKTTIARGVSSGVFAYVGKIGDKYEPFTFKTNLSPSEVEISEDMYIIKGEDAEIYQQKITQPPQLTTLVITPINVSLKPQTQQAFYVEGTDQYGEKIDTGTISWSAFGGKINSEGLFTAGDAQGNYFVTASAQGVEAKAKISITVADSDPISTTTIVAENTQEYTVDSLKESMINWQGEIPAQKWMQFYTKVLTRFTSNRDLKLTIEVKFTVEGDISEQQKNETKSALQELGLDDN
ncbi:MAG: ATP-binding protein [Gloeocapsa sp. DLM2.Bin57]|nr:MAG: ATP-binding protein [Gloeocapsa sp. DLM2.Bin57]